MTDGTALSRRDDQPDGSVRARVITVPEVAVVPNGGVPERGIPEVITVAHTKGGAGKSTLTSNLGFALAERGRRVLIVDLDKQCGQSMLLGIPGPHLDRLSHQPMDSGAVLRGVARLHSALWCQVHPNLDIVPGHEQSLAQATDELMADGAEGQVRLYEVLFRQTEWDVILLDTPGTQSPLLTFALTASTGVLIPAIPEAGPVAELRTVLDYIAAIADVTGAAEVLGVVRMRVGGNATYRAVAETRIRQLCDEYAVPLLRNKVPEDAKLGEAQLAGLPVGAYVPMSRSAIAFRYLAEEVDAILEARAVANRPPTAAPDFGDGRGSGPGSGRHGATSVAADDPGGGPRGPWPD